MFPILGPDYIEASGERRYKSTDPATVVSAEDMNQVMLSLHRVVTAAGLTLNANNATEVSENWIQLRQAIQRIGWSFLDPVSVNIAEDYVLNPAIESSLYILSEASALGEVGFYLGNAETYFNNMSVVLYNNTPSRKFVMNQDDDSVIGYIAPGKSVMFAGRSVSGNLRWYLVSATGVTEEVQSVTMDSSGAEGGVSTSVRIQKDPVTRLTTLTFPASATLAAFVNNFDHCRILDLNVNASESVNKRILILLEDDAGIELGYCMFITMNVLAFYKADGTNFTNQPGVTIYFPTSFTFRE